MRQSISSGKNEIEDRVFTSIFTPKSLWPQIFKVIYDRQLVHLNTDDYDGTFLIFLSLLRGASIRLVVSAQVYESDSFRETLFTINSILKNSRVTVSARAGSVTSLFMDFPPNSIHYSLFNERYIARNEPMLHLQKIISASICRYFCYSKYPNEQHLLSHIVNILNEIRTQSALSGSRNSDSVHASIDMRRLLTQSDLANGKTALAGLEDLHDFLFEKLMLDFNSQLAFIFSFSLDQRETYRSVQKLLQFHFCSA